MQNNLHRRGLLLALPAFALAGCSDLIGPGEAPSLYTIDPTLAALPSGPTVAWALSVQLPDASGSFDTNRIALVRAQSTMDYYADAAWPDRLPLLVQQVLVRAFQDSGRIGAVAREEDALHADYMLATSLRDFSAHYASADGAPEARVSITAQLATTHGRKLVATRTVSQDVPASANSVPAVVQAFNQALASVVTEIVAWVLSQPGPPAASP
jgi:cholesterol transport system auxiliary component